MTEQKIGQFAHEGTTYDVIKTHYQTATQPVALVASPVNSTAPYDDIILSVNLEGYGMSAWPGYIFIDHKIANTPLCDAFEQAMADPNKTPYAVKYGYAQTYALPVKGI